MANTKSKVTKTKTESTEKAVETTEIATAEPAESSAPAVAESAPEKVPEKKQYKVRKNLDPNTVVTVKNGYQGTLVYISSKTKETFKWEEFGDEQDMELQELKNARNASKGFFENNWFLIDDPEIIEYLGVEQYYKYALNYDEFNGLFDKTPEEIKSIVSKLSAGQKKTVAYRAKQLISDGEIDSIKVITALEDSLSVELIDR